MSGANEGMPLAGLIDPTPKRKRPTMLMIRFRQIRTHGDLGKIVNCCFEAGAVKLRVEATDFSNEISLIKITTTDASSFVKALRKTAAKGLHRIVWRT